jgi:hypothetical protein
MPTIKDVERVVFKVTTPGVDDDGELHDIKTVANAKGETSFKITSQPGC